MKAAEDDLKLSNYCKEELVHVAGLEHVDTGVSVCAVIMMMENIPKTNRTYKYLF